MSPPPQLTAGPWGWWRGGRGAAPGGGGLGAGHGEASPTAGEHRRPKAGGRGTQASGALEETQEPGEGSGGTRVPPRAPLRHPPVLPVPEVTAP